MMNNLLMFAAGELVIVILMLGLIAVLKGGTQATRHLYFGSVVLTSLALVFMLGMAMYFFAPPDIESRGKEIFEACKQIIPPMLSLVIGFYFGKKSEAEEPKPKEAFGFGRRASLELRRGLVPLLQDAQPTSLAS